MAEYRHTTTGEVKTQGQWRSHYSNVSLPRTWKLATLAGLSLEAVLPSPAATTGAYQSSVRDGVEQDANGNWVEKYVTTDMFSDTTDEVGLKTTKADKEASHQVQLDIAAGVNVRTAREALLRATDHYALTDVWMEDVMLNYRQALRDITDHANFPNLLEADWPMKP